MSSKQALRDKINELILVTEENRTLLLQALENLRTEEDLSRLEEIVNMEEHIIENTLQKLIEAEIEAGNEAFLQHLNEAFKEGITVKKEASKAQEKTESAAEEQQAEDLLKELE